VGVLLEAYRRARDSYDVSVKEYELRVLNNVQPTSPGINSFNLVTQEHFLVGTNVIYILITGLLFLLTKHRAEALKPETRKLRVVMVAYNASNVAISAYIVHQVLTYKMRHKSAFMCNSLNLDDDGLQISFVFYVFFLQKLWEFMDTWLFIIRKSFRQITFLHLFHHSSITVVVGSILPFEFNGDMYLPILLNSCVHILVYLHYLLTSFGIRSFWSPYLTALQLGQFSCILTQSLLAYFEGPLCGSPDFVKILLIIYMGSMWLLFWAFFMQRYVLNQQPSFICGVIKSIEPGRYGLVSAYHGNVVLNDKGEGIVRLPRTFVELSQSVMYCYQLCPVGVSMPNIYVSQEVSHSSRGYRFAVAGGKPGGKISWMVCTVPADDKIAH